LTRHSGERRVRWTRWLLSVVVVVLVAAVMVTALALWAVPPGWLLPAHRAVVDALRWMKKSWLNAAAIGAAAGVAAVVLPFVLRRLDRPSERQAREQAVASEQTGKQTVKELQAISRSLDKALVGPVPNLPARRQPVGQLISDLAGPFALGVHKAIDAEAADLPELTVYVPREHDRRLRQIIEHADRASTMVVLVGDSSTGKTRALWEAIGYLPKQWRLWSPADARALSIGLSECDIGPRTVLWLNDAHDYLDPRRSNLAEGNAARLRELIGGPGGPVLVAATLWPANWQQLTAQPRMPGEQEPPEREQTQIAMLLESATSITVSDSFEGGDLAAISAAAGQDPRLGLALQQAAQGRIIQYLAGAPVLLERYETAPAEAKALIDAAIDARRLGHANRLPERLLLDAAVGYIDDETWDRLGDGWSVLALRTVSEDWRGLSGPLTQIRPRPGEPVPSCPAYRLADILEQAGARARRLIAPPKEFWIAATHHGNTDDLGTIGDAAWIRGRYRHAAALFLRAADADRISGLLALAKKREEAGDPAEAERLYRLAADAGDAGALQVLAKRQEQAGNHTEAERLAVRAAQAGDTGALIELAERRDQAGNHTEAERLAVRAAQAGDTGARPPGAPV
jgi:hypothetical protein